MLTAAGLAFAALTASTTLDALPLAVPPITIEVTAAYDIPRALVDGALAEAHAIWRAAGVRLIWNRLPALIPATLQVFIGGGLSNPDAETRPLGWIVLDAATTPAPKIYVSHANAVQLLLNSRAAVGSLERMPAAEREMYLARAMGRALAHEIGHYLFGSKLHTRIGLMSAIHGATAFFGPTRATFRITTEQRQLIAARFTSLYIASRR